MYVASTDQWCEKPISMPEPFQKSIESKHDWKSQEDRDREEGEKNKRERRTKILKKHLIFKIDELRQEGYTLPSISMVQARKK